MSHNDRLKFLSHATIKTAKLMDCRVALSGIWFMIQYSCGSVAQWIEQLRPKEKVVRSTRIWATRYYMC